MPIGRFAKDMSGQRFGRWTVLEKRGVNERGHAYFLCRCDCGQEREVVGYRLRNSRSTSCGCYAREASSARAEHGMAKHPLFKTWNGIRERCSNPNSAAWARYGGRGILLCDRWQDVRLFIADNEAIYVPGLTIDRINNDGHYEPGNVRWVTRQAQNLNYSKNVYIEFRGKRQTMKEWADEQGIGLRTLWHRLRVRQWPVEKALTEPVRHRPRRQP